MDDDEGPLVGNNKRVKPTVNTAVSDDPVAVGEGGGRGVEEVVLDAEVGDVITCSKEMEARISQIFEKIDHFTQQVADMLEEGKAMFKNLSAEFEERLIAIHQEQIDKWQEEINGLRLLDASNEEAGALLQKARYHLLQHAQIDT